MEYSTKLLLGQEQNEQAQQVTGVLRKSGFSAILNIRNSNKHLYLTEHLCF